MSKITTISLILFLLLFKVGFGIPNEKLSSIKEDLFQTDNSNRQKIELKQPTVIIVQLDSTEIEQLKDEQGEDIFYTAADDLMWYNSMLIEKMDSLNIPVTYIKKDTVDVKTPDSTYRIIKDSTFSLYTYFYFDGRELSRKDLFELLED